MKRKISIVAFSLLLILTGLVFYAYLNTWHKTNLVVSIHINEKLVLESSFGESPTFAIWLENPETGKTTTIYATRRAAEGDWEGKAEVPAALPKWFEVLKEEADLSRGDKMADGYSGATPKPGFFTTGADLLPGSKWICWIEVNLAGDFNDYYKGNLLSENEKDKYLSGQPALLYRSDIAAIDGEKYIPKVIGMTVVDSDNGQIIQPLKGITTATEIFDEMSISIEKPKPRIIKEKLVRLE